MFFRYLFFGILVCVLFYTLYAAKRNKKIIIGYFIIIGSSILLVFGVYISIFYIIIGFIPHILAFLLGSLFIIYGIGTSLPRLTLKRLIFPVLAVLFLSFIFIIPAKTNSAECLFKLTLDAKEDCYRSVAALTGDVNLCKKLRSIFDHQNVNQRADCYNSVLSLISNTLIKINPEKYDLAYCHNFLDTSLKNFDSYGYPEYVSDCYYFVIRKGISFDECNTVPDDYKELCSDIFMFTQSNIPQDFCETINNVNDKNRCYFYMASKRVDNKYCLAIGNSSLHNDDYLQEYCQRWVSISISKNLSSKVVSSSN